jgi:hypothetical protein
VTQLSLSSICYLSSWFASASSGNSRAPADCVLCRHKRTCSLHQQHIACLLDSLIQLGQQDCAFLSVLLSAAQQQLLDMKVVAGESFEKEGIFLGLCSVLDSINNGYKALSNPVVCAA